MIHRTVPRIVRNICLHECFRTSVFSVFFKIRSPFSSNLIYKHLILFCRFWKHKVRKNLQAHHLSGSSFYVKYILLYQRYRNKIVPSRILSEPYIWTVWYSRNQILSVISSPQESFQWFPLPWPNIPRQPAHIPDDSVTEQNKNSENKWIRRVP